MTSWQPPEIFAVTAKFSPNTAFMLMSSPSDRRLWHEYIKLRNWKERNGSRIRWAAPGVEEEIKILRDEISKLRSRDLRMVNKWIAMYEERATA